MLAKDRELEEGSCKGLDLEVLHAGNVEDEQLIGQAGVIQGTAGLPGNGVVGRVHRVRTEIEVRLLDKRWRHAIGIDDPHALRTVDILHDEVSSIGNGTAGESDDGRLVDRAKPHLRETIAIGLDGIRILDRGPSGPHDTAAAGDSEPGAIGQRAGQVASTAGKRCAPGHGVRIGRAGRCVRVQREGRGIVDPFNRDRCIRRGCEAARIGYRDRKRALPFRRRFGGIAIAQETQSRAGLFFSQGLPGIRIGHGDGLVAIKREPVGHAVQEDSGAARAAALDKEGAGTDDVHRIELLVPAVRERAVESDGQRGDADAIDIGNDQIRGIMQRNTALQAFGEGGLITGAGSAGTVIAVEIDERIVVDRDHGAEGQGQRRAVIGAVGRHDGQVGDRTVVILRRSEGVGAVGIHLDGADRIAHGIHDVAGRAERQGIRRAVAIEVDGGGGHRDRIAFRIGDTGQDVAIDRRVLGHGHGCDGAGRRVIDRRYGDGSRPHRGVQFTVIDADGDFTRRFIGIFRNTGIGDRCNGGLVVGQRGRAGQFKGDRPRTREAAGRGADKRYAGRQGSDRKLIAGKAVGQLDGRAFEHGIVEVGDQDTAGNGGRRAVLRVGAIVVAAGHTGAVVVVEIQHRRIIDRHDMDCRRQRGA